MAASYNYTKNSCLLPCFGGSDRRNYINVLDSALVRETMCLRLKTCRLWKGHGYQDENSRYALRHDFRDMGEQKDR